MKKKEEQGQIDELKYGQKDVEPIEELPFFVVEQYIFVVEGQNDKVGEPSLEKIFSKGDQYHAQKECNGNPIQ